MVLQHAAQSGRAKRVRHDRIHDPTLHFGSCTALDSNHIALSASMQETTSTCLRLRREQLRMLREAEEAQTKEEAAQKQD